MDYQDIIDIARRAKPLNRVKIQGGQTEGFIKVEPVVEKTKSSKALRGKDYALKYQIQDEQDQYEEKEEANGGMSTLEETTIGCAPNPFELIDEQLLQVYDNYSFENKSNNELLVHEYKQDILDQVDVSPIVIIKGGTGCGKTTQVPQFILDSAAESNIYCNIIVTQPRRLAAISVAKRVCHERGWGVGSVVGYQIALEKSMSKDTRLLYCTTGVLLHHLIAKKELSNYTHIIVDEVHERDQETDFLLILLKRYLRKPGCRTKVILMSATINIDKFVSYFSKKVSGTMVEPPVIELEHLAKYPVYYYYLDDLMNRLMLKIPEIRFSSPVIEPAGYDLAVTLIEAFYKIDKSEHKTTEFIGSVLIFLPGLHEIENMYEKLSSRLADKKNKIQEEWWLCPLHSSVTFEEQLKVFKPAPERHRKIILATNIAESSITVPDVKYVIDFCLMKQQVQEIDSSYSCLQLAWISKSQGCQRAGRVGRVMPGRVYRIIPQQLYEELDEYCFPEILRSPLDQLVLKAKKLDSGPPASILGRALDPPDLSNIHRTILYLKQMGAIMMTVNGEYDEDDGDLTFIGHIMATLPLDTNLSKLIILGHMFSLLGDCVIMASAMAVKSMFSTPFKQQLEAYNSKLSWADSSCSDPIAFLNAYKVWRYHKNSAKFIRSGGSNESEWARRYFIQLHSMKEVARLENELHIRLKSLGIVEHLNQDNLWEENVQKPLILKLIIAGAFYPNYFIRRQIDEKEAVKVLGGRDPFSSVYLANMPLNQPARLYASAIKKYFSHCGSQINIFCDGSSKVYLQFGSSSTETESGDGNAPVMPGKIMMAVYRAIKLRHLQIPIQIPLLPPQEATKRAKTLFGESPMSAFCFSKRKEHPVKKSNLPGLHTNYIEVVVTHVTSPSKFWTQLQDTSQKLIWLHNKLNFAVGAGKVPNLSSAKVGESCIAPYSDQYSSLYYRANIVSIGQKKTVQVLFIDYGNIEWLLLSDLKGWTSELQDVKEEPALGIPAMLSEIQPSLLKNPKGNWSKEATNIFKQQFQNSMALARVYSVVEGVMSLAIYTPEEATKTKKEMTFERSFNNYLIVNGFAEQADEPYLSRENHMVREMALNSPDSILAHTAAQSHSEPPEMTMYVDAPSESECKNKVTLKGPRSPLEMSLYSLTKNSQGKEVQVEWSSVNSVLLDTYPMDAHDRMLVAGMVTQSSSGDRITLRNTTMMPNIHGLCALITMIFAPCCELRVNRARTQLIGVLCGLGCDPITKEPYFLDNDLELCFDTVFDLEDLENINRVRFWMNYMVSGGSDWQSEICESKMAMAQGKIKEFILGLLSKTRPSCAQSTSERAFGWGLVEEERLLHPRDGADEPPSLYPLIWGISLDIPVCVDPSLIQNIELLQHYAKGKEQMRSGVLCKLCQVYLDSLHHVRLHLQSSVHRNAYKQMITLKQ